MKKPHLLARCLEPVAMTEASLRVCIAIASDDAYFATDRAKALEAAGGMPMLGEPRAPMVVENGQATIAIEGPLVRKAGAIADVSGMTSYSAIRKDLRAALADPKVTSIVFAVDSPGGEVSGLFEMADELYSARGKKPIRAEVVDACSAAFVLAAAIGNVSIEQAGTAGSVGVRMGVQRPASDGGVIEFVSSGAPLKVVDPASDEGRAEYQGRVDYLHSKLIEKVALYRGVTVEQVATNYGKGAVMYGAQAVAAGLVDRVGTAPAATARPSRVAARAAIRSSMATAADPVPPVVPVPDEEKPAAADGLKCAGCSSDATSPMYCATCAGKGELPDDLMPAAKAARLFGVLGAANIDSALGIAAAAMEAHKALPGAIAKIAAMEADGNRRQLRATLEQGIADRRLNLGRIRSAVVEQLAALDESKGAAITAALAALDETQAGNAPSVLDAVCSVDPGAAGLRIVAAYCKSATPTHGDPVVEPAHDSDNGEAFDAAISAQSQRITAAAAAARKSLDRGSKAAASK